MRRLLITILVLSIIAPALARIERIYFAVVVNSDPSGAQISLKSGPLLDWEYMGTSPLTKVFYKDFDISCFMSTKERGIGKVVYYSNRYGSFHVWADAGQLFNTLVRDFGDAIISDLGNVTCGAVMAESPGYEAATRIIEINGNITSTSFNQDRAAAKPNFITLPLRPIQDEYYEPGFPRDTIVQISTDPPGSAIYCNEKYIGQSPCKLNAQWWYSEDRLEIRTEKSGYITNRRMITPTDERIHIVLQPMY